MKRINLYGLLLFSATLIINSGCSEETLSTVPPTVSPPIANAGIDQTVKLPANSVTLNGSGSTDLNKNISTYLWKKIAGPPSFTISTPNAMQTAVADLTEGVYEFELTVTTKTGLHDNDTMTVTVEQKAMPTVFAGEDILVILPTNFGWLSGGYSFFGTFNIDNILWKKISGPSAYILESPDSLITKVSELEKGVYEFELTVTDKGGLTTKDIATVTVGEISQNPKEKFFNDLGWECPWGCSVEIKNIYSHLPAGSVFRIYIQRDNSANWEEVVHDSQFQAGVQYTYTLYNGNLIIYLYGYSSDPEDTPNIKIVY